MSNDPAAPAFTSKDADWKKPENQVQVPVWDKPEPYFEFEPKDRKLMVARMKPWRLVPDDKRIRTHMVAGTRDALDRVYENAIVIGSPVGKSPRMLGIIFCLIISMIGILMFVDSALNSLDNDYFGFFISVIIILISFLFDIWTIRAGYFIPRDQPIIFNRINKSISFVKVASPHFLFIWKPRPVIFRTYEWSLVKVRSYKYMEGSRGVMHDSYNLCLLWGDEPSNPKTFKDWVAIGYKGWWEDQRLFQIWEHIRRYMEENGPPINPGEKLREGVYTKKWGMAMPDFPPEVLAAAGRLLSDDEVAALARTPVNKTV